ncbi:DNA-binding transcriptional MerR regulator [Bosea sp. OAE506]|uniref:MerR family transcriptional regulator n=1 Tax=Bosea sp. OAE506 TaxID=2663870 RepID=UPI00178AB315
MSGLAPVKDPKYPCSMTIYTIRQMADEFGLTLRALRFYEQRGLIKPSRISPDQRSQRVYDKEDRARIAEIVNLTKMGFTLSEIAEHTITDEQYQTQLKYCRDTIRELEQAVLMIKERLRSKQ